MQNRNQSPIPNQYQNQYHNQNRNQSPITNRNQNQNQMQMNINSMSGLGSFDFGGGNDGRANNNMGANNMNQPISPETRQNFPRLKGPDTAANRIKKPEPALDPWASISLQDAS